MFQNRPDPIGRTEEKEALQELLTQATETRGQLVLLSGEAGIGKTSLLAYLQTRARDQGLTIVRGECMVQDRDFPYAPIIDSFRTHFSGMTGEELRGLLHPFEHELIKLLPELGYSLEVTTSAATLDPESEKRRLFEVLVNVYQRLSSTGLLLIFEDIHWADSNSIDFFQTLIRRISRLPILVVLSSRPNSSSNSDLILLQQSIERASNAHSMLLPALTPPQIAELAQTVLQSSAPIHPDLLETLGTLTQGNPLYTGQIVHMLQHNRQINLVNGRWIVTSSSKTVEIPSSVRQTVLLQLAQLNADSRQILQYAAVAGREFGLIALQEISGVASSELTHILKTLIRLRLLEEASRDRFAFHHTVLREAIYDSLLIHERQAIHLRLLRYLEHSEQQPHNQLADLSYHAYMAEDWEAALHYGREAGHYALSLHSPHAALEHFSHAIAAAEKLEHAERAELYLQRGKIFNSIGKFENAHEDFDSAQHIATRDQNDGLTWQVLIELARLWTTRDYTQVRVYSDQALALARQINDADAIAHSLNRLGNWHLNAGENRVASKYYEEALAIFDESDNLQGKAETLQLLGMTVGMETQNFDMAESHYQQAIAIHRQLDNRQALTYALANLGLGKNDLQPVLESVDIARQIGLYSAEAYACICAGNIYAQRGDIRQALEFTQRGLHLAQATHHREWLAAAHLRLGLIYMQIHAYDRAATHAEAGKQYAYETNSQWFIERSDGLEIKLLIAQGRLAEAETVASKYRLPDIFYMQTFQILSPILDLALKQRQPERILIFAERISQMLMQDDNNGFSGAYSVFLVPAVAEAYIMNGQEAQALPLLEKAARVCETQNMLSMHWQIETLLAQIHARTHPDSATRHLQKARSILMQLAETVPADLRDNFLRQAGQSVSGLKPQADENTPAHDLTRREMDIVREIARGKTNQQIAEDLHITIKTVEAHITRILSKLAMESRTQIALWAVQAGLK